MKKLLTILLAVVFLTTTAFIYVQQNRHTEAAKHPRIETAIRELKLKTPQIIDPAGFML
jgi:uncharacterized protein YxeA